MYIEPIFPKCMQIATSKFVFSCSGEILERRCAQILEFWKYSLYFSRNTCNHCFLHGNDQTLSDLTSREAARIVSLLSPSPFSHHSADKHTIKHTFLQRSPSIHTFPGGSSSWVEDHTSLDTIILPLWMCDVCSGLPLDVIVIDLCIKMKVHRI